MALPIIENPLYGLIQLETATWSSPFTWFDRTADLAGGFNYSEGGRVGPPGSSVVEVGTLNATFKDLATVPVVGDLVRLRKSAASVYIFTGYVQDVSQRIVFDNSVSLSTPVTLTTIHCLDWVGYISQFQALGAGGANESTGASITTSEYRWYERIAALNKTVDATFATKIINDSTFVVGEKQLIGDTDFVGSLAEHIDLLANSADLRWWGRHVLPTNKTTGRTGLVRVQGSGPFPIIAQPFTDAVGSVGYLHYTEIDFENSTQNISNTVVINNRVRFDVPNVEVTRIGGFNEENYLVINSTNVVGVAIDGTEIGTDASSITTYGIRQSVVDTNVAMPVSSAGSFNLVVNPSAEYSDDGYSGGAAVKCRRRQPLQDANPFAAYNGLWAMRSRQGTAGATAAINFSGGEADGIPVVGGSTYYFKAYAARGTTSRTDMRCQPVIRWLDEDEALISSTTGANVALTTANTWYLVSTNAAAPAGAVRATLQMSYNRSGGGNITVGDRLWADALLFSKTTDTYFDGDTAWDATNAYAWTGGVGASPSYKLLNKVDDIATSFVARFATTSMRATRIRWNAQESLSEVSSLVVGRELAITYEGTTTTYEIIGIDGNVDPERYMIDYYIRKV